MFGIRPGGRTFQTETVGNNTGGGVSVRESRRFSTEMDSRQEIGNKNPAEQTGYSGISVTFGCVPAKSVEWYKNSGWRYMATFVNGI
jgi:hypothetical protein